MKAEVRPSLGPAPSSDAPKTTAFQVGKVATDPWKASFQDASISVGAGEKEESYIPVQLARQSLQRVVDDMHEMKARQQEKVQAIMDRYAAIEASTKQHYEAFVLDIKRRALERVQTQKQQYAQLRLETDAERKVATAHIESLEASARDMHDRQVQMLAMYQSERETLLVDQALELGSLKRAYEVEQTRLRELWLAKTATLEQAYRWLHMRSEDDAARCVELEATLMAVTATAKHQQMDQVASAHIDKAIALHVAQVVSDLCWQVALLDRPLGVHQMTATETPRSAIVSPTPRRPSEPKDVICQETQTILDLVQNEASEAQTALVAAKRCEEALRHQLRAAEHTRDVCEAQIVRDVLDQLVLETACAHAAHNTPVVTRIEPTRVSPSPSLPLLRPPASIHIPPEYDHLIACELDMEALRDTAEALKTTTSDLHHKKTAAKQAIKDWLADFEATNHREPSIQDKAQVKDMYIAFKQAEEQYNRSREQLNAQKQLYTAKLAEVETLQSSQTMQTFPHHTLVAHLRAALDDTQRRLDVALHKPVTPALVDRSGRASTPHVPPRTNEAMTALQKRVEELSAQLQVAQANAQLHASASEPNSLGTADVMPATSTTTATDRLVANSSSSEAVQPTSVQAPTGLEQATKEVVHDEAALQAALDDAQHAQADLQHNVDTLYDRIRVLEADAATRATELAAGTWVAYGLAEYDDDSTPDDTTPDDTTAMGDAEASLPEPLLDEPKESPLPACLASVKAAIESGKAAWNKGDKVLCHDVLLRACNDIIDCDLPLSCAESVAAIKQTIAETKTLVPGKAAVALRKQLDAFVVLADAEPIAVPRPQSKTDRLNLMTADAAAASADPSPNPAGTTKILNEYKQKLKAMESKLKADKVKITQLENALAKADAAAALGGKGGKDDDANSRLLNKKLQDAEKKAKTALDEAEKQATRRIASLANELQAATTNVTSLTAKIDELDAQVTELSTKATLLNNVQGEVEKLRQDAEEQALRKKYYNTIEDMKGKIRVYCRCRPMSGSELERGCHSAVKFLDEYTLELETPRGPKSFAYDQVFNPSNTQDQVFEDTKNLLQSALDGYNVCIFAYGQTGSGKTFTMTGTADHPGITPRLIDLMFKSGDALKGNNTITYEAYMLELYNDALIDLFFQLDNHPDKAPKLEIKKNDKGMVVVQNIVVKPCTDTHQTLKLFDHANKKRQVGATKMNAESSRSHSVFTILIENYNKTTKKTSVGKLSLVDLAGSERAGKTGATADRLKEAQAINKSLSALGDVISALSTNEKFIPYRNNKLTQLMQDSLGGNAKTVHDSLRRLGSSDDVTLAHVCQYFAGRL
ncbi:hypothetical protein, variant [Saprolegnia diclina VS20]|uniref:Kinesin motor domain-containing protein n=1 Tax=Saprolegnia diclina (strain VS20) TaxID=1156394 RepID=T0Q7C7_SAPDV|nr:hypothetical protein, variant [Saprolegnia diclina VS20]EQC30486.1 hypothetical protein, variant [Saprolegnia diclina VS20]|eukprot:XP_008616079.1 hypothetical protein, variant [Saprolegnia diclina VS20]